MINVNWNRWIFASISKHFDANRQGITLYIEGQDHLKDPPEYVELRVTGPTYSKLTRNDYRLEIIINLLINVIKSEKDNHRIFRVSGIFEPVFDKLINIYKFGTGVDDNPLIKIGCLQLNSEIVVTHYGQLTPDIKLLQSTIEARYKIDL